MEKEYYEGLQDGSVVKGEHHIYNKDGEYIFSTLDKEIANDIIEMVNTYIKEYKTVKENFMKKFTIEVEMNERWIPHFMSMLKYMEMLGNKGSSKTVGIYSDGDGDFNPKFKTNIEWETKPPVSDNDGNRIYDAG